MIPIILRYVTIARNVVLWQKNVLKKMEAKPQPVENVLVVIKHQAIVKQKKSINCMRKGNNTNIDHTTYDRHCHMKQKKTRIQNNTDHGF